MTGLFAIPEGANALDVLAQRYRTAFDKTTAGRAMWIEGTLELAKVIKEAKGRDELKSVAAYSRWLRRNGLKDISPQDRSALNNFANDLVYARQLLEKSTSISWQGIWRDRPNKSQAHLSTNRKMQPQRKSKRDLIPDVIREANAPPEPKPTKDLSKHFLTREQVDPDFKGTALEFATAYGHVPLHTKQQIEYNKRQEALMAWIGTIADHERTGRAMLTALPAVDPATLKEWMAKPGKAEKIQGWSKSVQVACEALYNMISNV